MHNIPEYKKKTIAAAASKRTALLFFQPQPFTCNTIVYIKDEHIFSNYNLSFIEFSCSEHSVD